MLNLSDGEWRLMNTPWCSPPCTITRPVTALQKETGWSRHTVITMLGRLERKREVLHEAGKRAKQFYPAIGQEEARREETESFLSRLYGGSLGRCSTPWLIAGLSKQEVEALYEILKKAEEWWEGIGQ